MQGYTIADEPRPTAIQSIAVNPIWPLFSVMFGGTWLAWPWFALNGIALGSPTLKKEILLCVGGFIGSLALALGLLTLINQGYVTSRTVEYPSLVLVVWKLAISYWLVAIQSRTYGIYAYYGGPTRNPVAIIVATILLGPQVEALLSANRLLLLTLR